MKKNYKYVSLIPIVLMVTLLNSVSAQNVGIGTATPTEKLDVLGNLKFTGALMPNNNAGTTGRLLMSSGPGVAPTWGPPLLNTANTTNIGKFYVNGVALSANTTLTITVADPNCVPGSQISVSWAGLLPGTAAQNSNVRFYNVQAGAGQFVVVVTNLNVAVGYTGLSLAYTAFY
jgi:hypothetical protein